MGYLREEELYQLAFDHKYKSAGCSFLDGLIMQTWWKWLVEFLPTKHDPKASFHWTAPNTITLTGLLVMVLPASVMMWYCQDLASPVPSWIYIVNAIGIFIYQTMDALDGKQARRTNSQSPFGELFDHGCDAVSTIFCTMAIVCIRGAGVSWLSFGMLSSAMISFHFCHIQAYYLGYITFGLFDVTELQMAAITVNLIAGVLDSSLFSSGVLFGIPAGLIPATGLLGGSLIAVALNVSVVVRGKRPQHSPTSRREMVASCIALYTLAAVWFGESKERMEGGDGILFLLGVGFLSCIQSVSVIVAQMCKSTMHPLAHLYVLPLLLGALNAHLLLLPEPVACKLFFASALLLFLHLAASVSAEIAAFLGLSIFKVGPSTRVDDRGNKTN